MTDYDEILAAKKWEQAGQQIRETFHTCRQQFRRERAGTGHISDAPSPVWDGGQDRLGRQHTNIWPKIAQFCEQHKVSAETWIEEVFNSWPDLTPPQPTVFLSPQYLGTYQKALPELRRRMEARLRNQWELFQTQLWIWDTEGKNQLLAARAVLTDPLIGLMPMMRWLLATQIQQTDLADRFQAAAQLQVQAMQQMLTETCWAGLWPKEWMT